MISDERKALIAEKHILDSGRVTREDILLIMDHRPWVYKALVGWYGDGYLVNSMLEQRLMSYTDLKRAEVYFLLENVK